jgi:hypothetical protein
VLPYPYDERTPVLATVPIREAQQLVVEAIDKFCARPWQQVPAQRREREHRARCQAGLPAPVGFSEQRPIADYDRDLDRLVVSGVRPLARGHPERSRSTLRGLTPAALGVGAPTAPRDRQRAHGEDRDQAAQSRARTASARRPDAWSAANYSRLRTHPTPLQSVPTPSADHPRGPARKQAKMSWFVASYRAMIDTACVSSE